MNRPAVKGQGGSGEPIIASMPSYAADIDRIRQAAERIRGVAHRTPVVTSSILDALSGRRLFFKCENLQRVGAFKFRGAYNAVAALTDEDAARGVLTHSSGNHAQALAHVAPYEKLLAGGRPIELKTDNKALFFSGYRHKDELLVLVGNYENTPRTKAAVTLPFRKVAEIKDVRKGTKLRAASRLEVDVPPQEIALIYVRAGAGK